MAKKQSNEAYLIEACRKAGCATRADVRRVVSALTVGRPPGSVERWIAACEHAVFSGAALAGVQPRTALLTLPDSPVLRTLPEGYGLRVEVSDDGRGVVVGAWWHGKRVAVLDAAKSAAYPGFLRAVMVRVDKAHTRRGIATRLYVAAERAMGMKFVRGGYQSPEAKRLWAQKARPFGVDEP